MLTLRGHINHIRVPLPEEMPQPPRRSEPSTFTPELHHLEWGNLVFALQIGSGELRGNRRHARHGLLDTRIGFHEESHRVAPRREPTRSNRKCARRPGEFPGTMEEEYVHLEGG